MADFASLFPDSKKPILDKLMEGVGAFFAATRQFPVTEWKGYKFIPGFEAETAKYVYNDFDMDDNSVVIVSYPKTGTNWIAEVVRLTLYGHDEKLDALSKSIPLPLTIMEMGPADKFKLVEHIPVPRRLFWTHLPEELFNVAKMKKKNGKIIVILRNPKDTAVSWYHFAQTPILDELRDVVCRDWAPFVENYMAGNQPTISKPGEFYPDHILSWYKHKDDPDVLFVFFEDMKRDLPKEIRRIAKHLNVKLNDDRVTKIAEASSFSSMKKKTENKTSDTDKKLSSIKLMRKGQVGGWKDTFTVAQSEMMDAIIEEKLGKTDIKFTYEL